MYDVIWRTVVLDRLADLYVAASVPDRERMARGVERLNFRLRREPLEVGEEREDGFRVAFPPLLFVSFHVDEVRRIVRVAGVRRYGH